MRTKHFETQDSDIIPHKLSKAISKVTYGHIFKIATYNITGLNVTIPYKESVLDFLDDIDETAKIIGAVNTIKIIENKKVGYNTDHLGFKKSILNFIDCSIINKALILGNGGATKAIKYALDNLNIEHQTVSRKKGKSDFTYDQLNKKIKELNLLFVPRNVLCKQIGPLATTLRLIV